MNLNKAIEAFLNNPKLMDTSSYSTPKLMKRFGLDRGDIEMAKERTKQLLAAKEFVGNANTASVSVGDSIVTYVNESGIQEKKEDIASGETTVKFHHSDECLSEDQIWAETKMDRNKWNFVQIYHKKFGRGFLYTANFRVKQTNTQEFFQESFTEFLQGYKPQSVKLKAYKPERFLSPVSLIIPKQDAHLDKFDIRGNNNIQKRFENIQDSIGQILFEVQQTSRIEEIVYVLGSDQFNSEWTSMTTKGTPQSNLCTYDQGFQNICNFEIGMIADLAASCENLKVVYVPGNHDQYVGWHLVQFLQCYFRNTDIQFDISLDNTKYHQYNNTAIMLNHGDAIKPKDLASKFPQGFRKNWSQCDYKLILSGDKHTEMALEFDGIKYYRVPQMSSSTSYWDDKNGYIHSQAEMNIFMISESKGLKRIYKDPI